MHVSAIKLLRQIVVQPHASAQKTPSRKSIICFHALYILGPRLYRADMASPPTLLAAQHMIYFNDAALQNSRRHLLMLPPHDALTVNKYFYSF